MINTFNATISLLFIEVNMIKRENIAINVHLQYNKIFLVHVFKHPRKFFSL